MTPKAVRPEAVAPVRRGAAAPLDLWGVVALVLVVQSLWLLWFLVEPLPNAGNAAAGAKLSRWFFLTRALPQVMVDQLTWGESFLGQAVEELRHVENLPQRLPIVGAAALVVAAAVAVGSLALRALRLTDLARGERWALEFLGGASGLGVLTLVAGRLGVLTPWSARAGLAVLIAAGVAAWWRDRRAPDAAAEADPAPWWSVAAWGVFAVAVGPFLVTMALGAMLPTIDFDAIEYHLQGPKEYFQNGRIAFLPHNVYTSMPFGVEMLHLLGMEVRNDWWSGALAGQLVVAAFAPTAAVLVFHTARRAGSARAGWWGALVYLTTPWVYRLGVLPYVEGPLCAYHIGLFWAAARAWGEPDPGVRTRWWALAGLLAGGAMACKYPALVSAVLPFGAAALVDAVRRKSPAAVVAFSLGWAAVMTPWLAKNVVDTGNPVYPLGYNVFGGRFWDPELDAKWAAAHGPKPVKLDLLWESVVDVAGRSDWQSPLYVALAPLAFARPGSRRAALALAVFVAYLFLTWWLLTHRLDRFWLPLLPPAAALAGLGADCSRRWSWRAVLGLVTLVSVLTTASYSSSALTALNEWTAPLPDLRTRVPRILNPPLAALDDETPRGETVLLVGQAAVFHLDRPIVYNTVFNHETFETLARDRTPDGVRAALKALGVQHVYVDWQSIERFRSPGNYGFTAWVRPAEFDRLVKAGVLGPPRVLAAKHEVYRVNP